jgi:hypothetical protein
MQKLATALCLAAALTLMSNNIAFSASPQAQCQPSFLNCVQFCSDKFPSPDHKTWPKGHQKCIEKQCFPLEAKCEKRAMQH